MTDLAYMPATEAIAQFKARTLSPVELMAAVIARAEAVEPTINAFAARYYDEAMAKARKAEAKYAKPGGRVRALEGLPLAVKDDTAILGKLGTAGSLVPANHVGGHTNPSAERLIRAGAIVHARSTCPEFVWAWVCYSKAYGVTRNPWNPDYTCGASSGGSGAALAAGSATLATGSDSGGSIRHPAALCGVVGYKPPYGRNPNSPAYNNDAYFHIGPMTRNVDDCVLMQNVMAGPHPLDHNTVRPKMKIPRDLKDIKGMRIAWSMDLGYFEVAENIQRETRRTLEILANAGAEVVEVDAGWAAEAVEAAHAWGGHIYADDFVNAVRDHPDAVTDYTPYFAEANDKLTAAQFHRSMTVAGRVWWDHFGPLFKQFDAFLCPTVSTVEVAADMKPWDDSLRVNGKPVGASDWAMTGLFNMYGRCPVLAVPSGSTPGGSPTGIQIVARPYDDVTAFRIARALEQRQPWMDDPARRPAL
jgi:Asp-tRNA(Asn)/Glu-tRNA(Gln) amidotransferase A subunit family amidase